MTVVFAVLAALNFAAGHYIMAGVMAFCCLFLVAHE